MRAFCVCGIPARPVKTRGQTSERKLRGSYYTPDPLVDACLALALARVHGSATRWLDPSAGDGAFVRGLSRRGLVGALTGIEIDEQAAAACEQARVQAGCSGAVVHDSFFRWLAHDECEFDVVVGNPPYVRYQFLDASERESAERALARLELAAQGVANAWVLFVVLALARLREGGSFALVLPFELIATGSAGLVREFLLRECEALVLELIPRGRFGAIVQDVVLVAGRRAAPAQQRRIELREGEACWSWTLAIGPEPWTRYLLEPAALAAYEHACGLACVQRLGELARIQVAVVTGANEYFTVDDATLARYELHAWARPLLAKTSHALGLRVTPDDVAQAGRAGAPTHLLDFAAGPEPAGAALDYLREGEALGLPTRFKCRTRSPWYAVPHVQRGRLLLPKRSHRHHRLLLNEAEVYTTDTIYRGEPLAGVDARDLVAAFHGSLTLLSAELEGRTYGGGVLELTPSEIARLVVPRCDSAAWLDELDALSRTHGGQLDADDRLAARSDERIGEALPELAELLPTLARAREQLRARRFGQPLRGRA